MRRSTVTPDWRANETESSLLRLHGVATCWAKTDDRHLGARREWGALVRRVFQ